LHCKFSLNAGHTLSEQRADRLADAIRALDTADEVGQVLALAQPEQGSSG
jgi:hypothetical protein